MTVAAGLMLAGATSASAENWPSWRGPTQNGISQETEAPVRWDRETNVAWRLPLPGSAGATPVVWGDRIFLTSAAGEATEGGEQKEAAPENTELVLLAVSTEGKILWRQVVGHGDKTVRGDEGNAASPSPVTDGKHVWAMMANGALGCYTVDGKEVWKLDLQERYGKFRIAFGMTATPVLADGTLFVQLIHGDGSAETQEAMVVAIDSLTGEGIWQKDRITGATNENEHSYASPVLYTDADRKLLLTHGADYTIAYELASGREAFRLGGLNPHDDPNRPYHKTLRFVASPAAVPGMVVVPTAKNGPVFAIRPQFEGDLTGREEALIWKRADNTPDVPSPLIHDGLVY
ncbi:MAG: PQQ-binding-like beta-propeller repeat protein, partial [Planctomycetaceae bacterium]|nr:PQQ-binding-like beta-propeller repeat protein [Planctomycetaceae bacterium]